MEIETLQRNDSLQTFEEILKIWWKQTVETYTE